MQNADDILWTSGFFNERFPAPVSPLGWSHIGPLIEELALRDPLRYVGYPDAQTIPLTRLWHGHPYTNVRAFQIFYKVFPDFILPEDAYRYFPDGAVSIRKRAPYPRWSDAPRFVFSLCRAFFTDPFNVSPLNNYRHWARFTREHDARIAALRVRLDALAHAEPHAIFAALRDAERAHRGVLRIHRWSLMDADLTFGLLQRLAAAWIDREHANEIAARLVADVPNKTMEVDAALREIGHSRLEIGDWRWQAFLAEHGHRSFSLDLAVPTFADEPSQAIRLAQMMPADNQPPTAAVIASEAKQSPTGSAEIASSPRSLLAMTRAPSAVSGLRSVVFRTVLSLTRHYVALREDQRYYWQKSLAVARRLYLLLAERLVAEGVIAERSAVFYATHDELAEYFDARRNATALAQAIAARQAEWYEYQREFEQSPTTAYPPFLRGDVPPDRVGAESPRPCCWRGRAISPGSARGVARVIQSADELSRVQRGDILVAPATDPAWTPVFAHIAGLVVERGGMLSHSAVVAREYHIPAVAGIANIVAEIQDGEVVEVDGSNGLVSRAADETVK